MANDLTTSPAGPGSATPSSSRTTTLAASIPAWVDRGELTRAGLHGYGLPIPEGAGAALRTAAVAHRGALAGALPEETDRVLRGLRSATILPNEHAAEAEASFRILRVHLADVPLDILEAACRAYCNAPGRRFFPRSAGELRAFVNPLLNARTARAYWLERLARQADEADAERKRLEDDPLTPEAMAEIKARFGLAGAAADRIEPGKVAA